MKTAKDFLKYIQILDSGFDEREESFTVQLKIGTQSFNVAHRWTRTQANQMKRQLAMALHTMYHEECDCREHVAPLYH